jgi:polyhydroxybutyrate depolymerase
MKKFLLLFSVAVTLSVRGQLLNDSVLIEGHYRVFRYEKPSPSLRDASLIFVLHGSRSSALAVRQTARRLARIATAENVMLVYPEGYKSYWNECRKAANSPPNLENINEQAFFDSMISYFEKKYPVNHRKIFAIGTSGGGHMVYKLALMMPEMFRAFTAIIASLPTPANMDCRESNVPVAMMIINGTKDPVSPYEGGLVTAGGITMGSVRGTEATFSYWAKVAGYSGNPTKELLPDRDPADGKTIEKYTYSDVHKPDVVLLKVIGGHHDYPNDIDVYLESWNFFKRQMNK